MLVAVKWRDLGKAGVQSAQGSEECERVYLKTPVVKWDLVVECRCRQCSQGMPGYWKSWNGGSKEEYQEAKQFVKHALYLAKSKIKQGDLKNPSPSNSDLFLSCPQWLWGLCLDDRNKQAVWKEPYERL